MEGRLYLANFGRTAFKEHGGGKGRRYLVFIQRDKLSMNNGVVQGSIPRLWIYKITVFAIYSEFYAEKQQKST